VLLATQIQLNVKSQVALEPFDWNLILPYLIPIVVGIVGFSVVGMLRKQQERGQGFEFFDEMTGGGIPDAYSVMVIGGASSGKSVLCQQLAYSYLTQGKSCVYVTYDSFPFEVRRNMENFQWGVSRYEQEGTFKFVDAYSATAGLNSEEEHCVEQPFALPDLGITLSTAMNTVKQKPTRVFLDSTASLFARVDPTKVIEFIQDRSAKVKGDNGVFCFTVGQGIVPSDLMRRLEEIVDCIIELDVPDAKGKTWKRLRIRKLRGRKATNVWISFNIESRKGIIFLLPKGWSKSKEARGSNGVSS
jgi:KaiC/GvpD/RAD55 family RecA-like ATPase